MPSDTLFEPTAEHCSLGDCGEWKMTDLDFCDSTGAATCACVEYAKDPSRLPSVLSPWINGDNINSYTAFTTDDYMENGAISFGLFWLNVVIIIVVVLFVFHFKRLNGRYLADTQDMDAGDEVERDLLENFKHIHEAKKTHEAKTADPTPARN